jgi:hypothetical protein
MFLLHLLLLVDFYVARMLVTWTEINKVVPSGSEGHKLSREPTVEKQSSQ